MRIIISSGHGKRAPTKFLPPIEYLRECFAYDHETGVLTWKHRPEEHFASKAIWATWNRQNANRPAGLIDSLGYCVVHLGRRYRVHRIIWKLMTGEEPPKTIDHRDRNSANNAWNNLRAATMSQQNFNAQMPVGMTGCRGVTKEKNGRYGARIKFDGVRRRLGSFDTIEEASAAYETAAREAL